jgi:hypothetical protein
VALIEVPDRFVISDLSLFLIYLFTKKLTKHSTNANICVVKALKIIIKLKTTCKKILQKIFRNADRPRKDK